MEEKTVTTRTHDQWVALQTAALAELGNYLDEKGFARGIFGTAPHHRGLPKIPNILIRPTASDHSGSTTVVVGLTTVYQCVVAGPYSDNDWNVWATKKYRTRDELDYILNNYCYPSLGIWGTAGIEEVLKRGRR